MGCEDCRRKRRVEPEATPPININVRRGSTSPVTAYLVGLGLGFALGRVLPPVTQLLDEAL